MAEFSFGVWKMKDFSILSLAFVALVGSSVALAGGKHADKSKASKECTEKGGTWDKKKKACNLAKAEEAPKTETTAPDDKAAPANPE
ncbi:MAG: hypothetical protein NTX25_08050 [Proteobacteria bacterium]|nr:hypothetical protein [Pseudomonadota bacterium]